jgi:hypothetical protein
MKIGEPLLGRQAVFPSNPSLNEEADPKRTFLQIGTKNHRDAQSVSIQTHSQLPKGFGEASENEDNVEPPWFALANMSTAGMSRSLSTGIQ